MLRSIQAECFKVVHRPYFWITTILCALYSVGVIFCLEPVFNSIFAFFVAHEVLSPRAYAGAALLILGILMMEADLSALLRPLRRKAPHS